jgi:hypothetical protein
MTCYHVTITDASRPENRTSGTRRAEPPVLGVGMGKSIMGAVICCKSNIRAEGTPKPSPWNPALGRLSPPRKGFCRRPVGGAMARQGRPYESRPTVRPACPAVAFGAGGLDTAKAGRSGLAVASLVPQDPWHVGLRISPSAVARVAASAAPCAIFLGKRCVMYSFRTNRYGCTI